MTARFARPSAPRNRSRTRAREGPVTDARWASPSCTSRGLPVPTASDRQGRMSAMGIESTKVGDADPRARAGIVWLLPAALLALGLATAHGPAVLTGFARA